MVIQRLTKALSGRRALQNIFEKMHKFALSGMNIGGVGEAHQSGEFNALHYIKNKFKRDDLVIFDVGANIGQYASLLVTIQVPPPFTAMSSKIPSH